MRLTSLSEDAGTFRLRVEHEPSDRGNVYYALMQGIPPGDRWYDEAAQCWAIQATPAHERTLGRLVPGFTTQLHALRAQLPLL